MVSRSKFETTLLEHYREEIDIFITESEQVYRSVIDYEKLDQKVQHLIMSARLDGIDEKDIWNILHHRIPSYVNYINYKKVQLKNIA